MALEDPFLPVQGNMITVLADGDMRQQPRSRQGCSVFAAAPCPIGSFQLENPMPKRPNRSRRRPRSRRNASTKGARLAGDQCVIPPVMLKRVMNRYLFKDGSPRSNRSIASWERPRPHGAAN
jgi:hypothetical protein